MIASPRVDQWKAAYVSGRGGELCDRIVYARAAPVNLLAAVFGPTRPQRERLSSCEQTVLELIANGYTNAEIGRLLGRSVETIKTQVRSILRILGASTRGEAVAIAVREGHIA